MIVGGHCGCPIPADDIFDPASGKVSTVTHAGTPPEDGRLLILKDGRALLVGGNSRVGPRDARQALAFSTLRGGTWSRVDSMAVPRWEHTATLLNDGSVIVVGGLSRSGVHPETAELLVSP